MAAGGGLLLQLVFSRKYKPLYFSNNHFPLEREGNYKHNQHVSAWCMGRITLRLLRPYFLSLDEIGKGSNVREPFMIKVNGTNNSSFLTFPWSKLLPNIDISTNVPSRGNSLKLLSNHHFIGPAGVWIKCWCVTSVWASCGCVWLSGSTKAGVLSVLHTYNRSLSVQFTSVPWLNHSVCRVWLDAK